MPEASPDRRSELWTEIADKLEQGASDIDHFRAPGGPNSRLAHWATNEPSFRWFKSYLQLAASTAPPDELKLLSQVNNRALGAPLTVTTRLDDGTFIEADLDYLYASEEVAFLKREMPATLEVKRVVELGGGFGRTAHMALATIPTITHYSIVDLPEALTLSRTYLRTVLDERNFDKLEFTDAAEARRSAPECDLFIQIDGFQEMDESTVNYYLDTLASPSRLAYVSNPVGKYDPSLAGVEGLDPRSLQAAMKLGLSLSMIDPWDERSLVSTRPEHVLSYCPSRHAELASEPSRLRPLYMHSIYQRIS